MSAFDGALSLSMTHTPGVCSLAVLALKTSSTGFRGSWYWVAGGFGAGRLGRTRRSQSMRLFVSGRLVVRLPSAPSKQLGETMSAATVMHEVNGNVLAALAALVPKTEKSASAQSASSVLR